MRYTLDKIKFNKVNTCPLCGNKAVEYSAIEPCGDIIYYPCECGDCGATWMEVYNLNFSTVNFVVDNKGNEYNAE